MTAINHDLEIKKWWSTRRFNYNKGLAIAGSTAFIAYVILASYLIAPYVFDFEINIWTALFQGTGYLLMMCIANFFYNLGPLVDKRYNKENEQSCREGLYNLGYWFSFGLPFLMPAMVVVTYFIYYH